MTFPNPPSICVVGLGYVGLPLAVSLAKHFPVLGFDINATRVEELRKGHDRTHEIANSTLAASSLSYTEDAATIEGHDIYIITVPTPIDHENRPDLGALRSASELVGKILKKNAIVVYESTVYPGVTEHICAPILETHSQLKSGKHFYLGYSPERINPGDKVHTVESITKVVSGQNEEVAKFLATVYGKVNNDNIFIAKSIQTAEAAKVIENAQRDINIAFINEIASIFARMGISVHDVLDAAKTKWNFLPFAPGLVGGHCIGVDPYYLAHAARQKGYEPAVILSGRRINENMSLTIASILHDKLSQHGKTIGANVLVLGLTFKENIPDLRNTKVIDLIRSLQEFGHHVDVHDPFADKKEAKAWYGIDLQTDITSLTGTYDAIIGAVPHDCYVTLEADTFSSLLHGKGLIADIKRIWPDLPASLPKKIDYWVM